MRIGGDAESYMDAPTLNVGGGDSKGGGSNGSFIANVLDLLGIQKRVEKDTTKGTGSSTSKQKVDGSPQIPVDMSVLDDAANALQSKPMTSATPAGQNWLSPITTMFK